MSNDDVAKSAGCAGRIVASGFFGIFLLAGLGFCGLIVHEAWFGAKTHAWNKVECRIDSAQAVIDWKKNNPYSLSATYTYEVAGKQYQSAQVSLKTYQTNDYENIQRMLLAYVPGKTATCWVDPQDAGQSVLTHGHQTWAILFIFIPLIFVLVGTGGIYGTWKSAKNADKPEPLKKDKASSRVGLRILMTIFLVVGGGVSIALIGHVGARYLSSRGWVATPCTIVHSEVDSHRSDDGTTYSAEVLYEYQVDGQTYRASRITFLHYSGPHGGANEIVRAYPSGGKATCYVNPNDPIEAVLRRGFQKAYLFVLIPVVFALIGLYGLIASFRPPKTATLASVAEHHPRSPRTAPRGTAATQLPADREAALVLKRRTSPYARFIIMSLVMFFWNGIVGVFVWQAVSSIRHGHTNWFLLIFLIPFVLVGLGLIAAAMHQFLALFNPLPQLRLTPGLPAPGGTAVLQWRLKGKAERIGTFKIELQGVEEATYQQGTRTTTDKSVFHNDPLVETSDPREMRSGEVFVTLPYPTMHTFQARHNKIVWMLVVEGDIARWPDIKEEFEIEVLP